LPETRGEECSDVLEGFFYLGLLSGLGRRGDAEQDLALVDGGDDAGDAISHLDARNVANWFIRLNLLALLLAFAVGARSCRLVCVESLLDAGSESALLAVNGDDLDLEHLSEMDLLLDIRYEFLRYLVDWYIDARASQELDEHVLTIRQECMHGRMQDLTHFGRLDTVRQDGEVRIDEAPLERQDHAVLLAVERENARLNKRAWLKFALRVLEP